MRTITREVGKTSDGKQLVRNYFFFNDEKSWMTKAQSHFTKDEKKQAKLNCK